MRIEKRSLWTLFGLLAQVTFLLVAADRPAWAADARPARSASALEEEEEEEEEEGEEEGEEEEEAAEPAKKDGGAKGTAVPRELPFEKLVEINSRAIFGGKAKVRGEDVELTFSADGEVKAGFEGTGIIDSKSPEMTGSNRKFIRLKDKKNKDEEEQLLPGLCAAGVGEGAWVSRFTLAGSPWVQMTFRIPNLIGVQSAFKMRVNWNKGAGIETNFFQTVSTLSSGKPKATKTTSLPEYKGPPLDWFPRKGPGVKVEFGVRGGKAQVRLDGKEIASMAKVGDKGGKVALTYAKLLFTIQDLKVSGKLDRPWCEKRIEELKASGKLKTVADPAPPDPLGLLPGN